jgi:tripartite-type tricarboxylate transporter receptor subunit TctC
MLRAKSAFAALAAAAIVTAAAPVPAGAQSGYPSRTITIVVPFPAGGPNDIIARIVASALQQSLGQSVVIDNRGGAGGNPGITHAARATPDGYTLLFTSTAIAVNPGLFANLPYDPIKDFVPISEIVSAPNVLFVRPDSGFNSIADLVAKAKAEPDKLNYASPGVGTKSHLTGELFKLRAGVSIQHIPYRGGGPATQALVSGTVQLASVALAPVEPLIKSGTVRALAVTGATRWYSLPDVPTMIESGFPGFVSDTFNAMFAPTGTPPEIVALVVKHVHEAMKRPDVVEACSKYGYQIVASTPKEMTARLVSEIAGVKELVARAGIKPEN